MLRQQGTNDLVTEPPRDVIPCQPRQADFRRPRFRFETHDLKFDRQVVLYPLNIGVDAENERLDNLSRILCVAFPLDLHISPVSDQPGKDIPLQRAWPQNLCQTTFPGSPPHLHLPEPVLGGNKPLSEKQIPGRSCINMRNTPPVTEDLHRLQPVRELYGARQLCEGVVGFLFEIGHRGS